MWHMESRDHTSNSRQGQEEKSSVGEHALQKIIQITPSNWTTPLFCEPSFKTKLNVGLHSEGASPHCHQAQKRQQGKRKVSGSTPQIRAPPTIMFRKYACDGPLLPFSLYLHPWRASHSRQRLWNFKLPLSSRSWGRDPFHVRRTAMSQAHVRTNLRMTLARRCRRKARHLSYYMIRLGGQKFSPYWQKKFCP